MNLHNPSMRPLVALFAATALALAACGGDGAPAAAAPAPSPAPVPLPTPEPAPPSPPGQLTMMAGPSLYGDSDPGCRDAPDGVGAEARFRQVLAMTEGPASSVLLAEWAGTNDDVCPEPRRARVRHVSAQGRVTTLAHGAPVQPGVPKRTFVTPTGVAVGSDGSVFIGDGHPPGTTFSAGENGQAVGVWKLSPDGRLAPWAGIAKGYGGDFDVTKPQASFARLDGRGTNARFINVSGLVSTGDDVLYLEDAWFSLRRVGPQADVTTIPGSSVSLIAAPGGDVYALWDRRWHRLPDGEVMVEPGEPAEPRLHAVDARGNFYVAHGSVVYRLARDGTRTLVVGEQRKPLDPPCGATFSAPPDSRCPQIPYRGNEPGPLPAHLGAIQALTAGADRSLYILADGALLKATLAP